MVVEHTLIELNMLEKVFQLSAPYHFVYVFWLFKLFRVTYLNNWIYSEGLEIGAVEAMHCKFYC